jgi:hypothetical protein
MVSDSTVKRPCAYKEVVYGENLQRLSNARVRWLERRISARQGRRRQRQDSVRIAKIIVRHLGSKHFNFKPSFFNGILILSEGHSNCASFQMSPQASIARY